MKNLTENHIQKIDDKLDLIGRYHDELMEDLPPEREFINNRVPRRSIEKTVELIADAIVDVAMIIISAKGFEKPIEACESITVINKREILSEKLSVNIKNLIRFRNLLVHQYAKIDEKREYHDISENHEDMIDFIKEIEEFLRKEKIN